MTDTDADGGCRPRLRRSQALPWIATGLVILATASILLAMGRLPICACGTVKLLHLETMSSENSQHIADWYTPSHVIHGFLLYGLLALVARALVAPRLPGRRFGLGWRVLAATIIEAGWEIAENTDRVIEHYRAATISLDYYGDSVLNSTADILAMLAGFALAARLPARAVLALALGFEVLTTLAIRDGLALNVLMLVWPLDAVRAWQIAA